MQPRLRANFERQNVAPQLIGWESYGGAADTLWFDDVALGTTRIGC